MWTVTLLLKPLIVMGHLLGGLTTLGLLLWLILEERRRNADRRGASRAWPVVAGLVVLVCQIALGGWTSSNYAALACPDVPTCQGQWWPEQANFAEGFVLWRGLGINYEFGVLDAPSRVAIHFTHRLGATADAHDSRQRGVVGQAPVSSRRRCAPPAALVLATVVLQVSVGVGIVWFGMPLPLATSHNGVAAMLLLTVINLLNATSFPARLRSGAER